MGLQELGTLLRLTGVVSVTVVGLLNGVSAAHHRRRCCASHHDPLCHFCQQILRIVPASAASIWGPLARCSLLDDAPASHLNFNCQKASSQLVWLKNVEYYFE